MTYNRLFFVLYWFAPFLKFDPLPFKNPRCGPDAKSEHPSSLKSSIIDKNSMFHSSEMQKKLRSY